MTGKDEIKEELKKLSPFLLEMKNQKEGFKIPENYFSNLSDKVLEKIEPEKTKTIAPAGPGWLEQLLLHTRWLWQTRPALVLASVTLLLLIAVFLLRPNQPFSAEEQWADIPTEALQNYVVTNLDEFDTELLLEMHKGDIQWELTTQWELEEEDVEKLFEEIIDDIELEDLEEIL